MGDRLRGYALRARVHLKVTSTYINTRLGPPPLWADGRESQWPQPLSRGRLGGRRRAHRSEAVGPTLALPPGGVPCKAATLRQRGC